MSIGKSIREHREAAGLTRAELAQATGTCETTIVRVEQGQNTPNLHTAILWADYLKLSIDELIGRGVPA